jgi:mono/diheme cytochrome c family protein
LIVERVARTLVLGVLLGVPLATFLPHLYTFVTPGTRAIDIRGRIPQKGGWSPGNITASVGVPLRLRLTSDDVMHGFAIGQVPLSALDVGPGEVVETTITFTRPGKYVFYCTRWCSADHWRMRGTIEVSGPAADDADSVSPPLYEMLGLDLDAPHPAVTLPDQRPSAVRGAALGVTIPARFLTVDYHRSHSPAAKWSALRHDPAATDLSDQEVWDLVAHLWALEATPQILKEGTRLYRANCAACHGENGAGDGVMAAAVAGRGTAPGDTTRGPADFTDTEQMLGASPALLQGKIIRGGMGTGMPNWGPIFRTAETWAIADFLFSFQFEPPTAGGDTARRR